MDANKNFFLQLLQYFQPINPFYTNILMEKKKFILSEINNSILPFFFYFSLIGLFFSYWIINVLSYYNVLFIVTGLQILAIVIIGFGKARNMLSFQVSYAIGGIYSIYSSVLRLFQVNPKKGRKDVQLSNIKMARYFITTTSAWIGQGIYNQSSSYDLIIFLSWIPLVVSESLIFFNIIKFGSLKEIRKLKIGFSDLNIFDRNLIISLGCSSTSTILQIYLSIFSQVILHSKEIELTSFIDKFFDLIDIPINYIAAFLIWVFASFLPIFNSSENVIKKIKMKSGYIEGTVKFLSITASSVFIYYIGEYITVHSLVALLGLSIMSFYILSILRYIKYAYFIYFITLFLLNSIDTLAKKNIHHSQDALLATVVKLILETLVHSIINIFCRLKNKNSKYKSHIYMFYSIFIFIILIGLTYTQ